MWSYGLQLEAREDENVGALTNGVSAWSDKREAGDMCHPKLDGTEVPSLPVNSLLILTHFPTPQHHIKEKCFDFFFFFFWFATEHNCNYI